MRKTLMQQREKWATLSLMMGMFFLPFGYDALFKLILDWTHSYWTTDAVFYCLSGLFFIAYCFFAGVNPVTALLGKVNTFVKRVIKLLKRQK